VIVPDATTILHYALDRFARIIENLVVYPENMLANMERTYGLYHSQRLLIKMIDAGMSRESAYDAVQPLAMQAWEEGRSFRQIVSASDAVTSHLSEEAIDDAFDPSYHLKNVDHIFDRVGL
jgi:adenylosuccinate lyase